MGNPWVFLPWPIPLPTRYPDPQCRSRFLQPFSWVWVGKKTHRYGYGCSVKHIYRVCCQTCSIFLFNNHPPCICRSWVLVGMGFWCVTEFGPRPTPVGTIPMYLPGTWYPPSNTMHSLLMLALGLWDQGIMHVMHSYHVTHSFIYFASSHLVLSCHLRLSRHWGLCVFTLLSTSLVVANSVHQHTCCV